MALFDFAYNNKKTIDSLLEQLNVIIREPTKDWTGTKKYYYLGYYNFFALQLKSYWVGEDAEANEVVSFKDFTGFAVDFMKSEVELQCFLSKIKSRDEWKAQGRDVHPTFGVKRKSLTRASQLLERVYSAISEAKQFTEALITQDPIEEIKIK